MRIGPIQVLAVALVLGLASPMLAQERPGRAPARDTAQAAQSTPSGPGILSLLPADSVTQHTLEVNGKTLAYTATAGTLDIYQQSGERSAKIFYTAYVLKDASAQARPVTFVFNGGPGAASAFLHLGLVGPKVLDFGPDARDGANATLRDNPDTWLDVTDLVLIDPVGTGWSRAAKNDDTSFYGVQPDAQVLAKTIALYLAHAGRMSSPKYLLGESYGGFRSVRVADSLAQDQGIVIAGIIMVSPLLEGALQFGAGRFALGAALQLPSLAAAQLERRRAFTVQAQAEAERFAMTEYLTTLSGRPPEGAQAAAFYARVAEMTGMPVDMVTRRRGFVGDAYVKNTAGNGDVVSPYDAAFVAPDPYPESDSRRGPDPVLDGFVRAYGGAFAAYARDELGFKTEITYTLLARDIAGKWDWGRDGRLGQASVTGDLRELLAVNVRFRLLIANGYSDLVVPYAVSRYVLDHLPPIGGADRVALKLYPGGHMMYTRPSSRAALSADARAFYRAAPE